MTDYPITSIVLTVAAVWCFLCVIAMAVVFAVLEGGKIGEERCRAKQSGPAPGFDERPYDHAKDGL